MADERTDCCHSALSFAQYAVQHHYQDAECTLFFHSKKKSFPFEKNGYVMKSNQCNKIALILFPSSLLIL